MNKYYIFLSYFLSVFLVICFFGINYFVLCILSFVYFFALELIIRLKNKHQHNNLIKHVSKISDLYIGSHPNLPYAYIPNTVCNNDSMPVFPLGNVDYSYPKLKIDAFGCPQLVNFKEPIHNYDNEININFLGDSVIGNFLKLQEEVYHIPQMIRENLVKSNIFIKAKNCSVGGYTIQDILVKFVLKDSFDNPSIVIINCGYASIRSFFYKNYSTDDSHFRKNFDRLYCLLIVRNWLPDFGLYSLKYLYQQFLPSNTRDDLLKFISKEGFDLSSNEKVGLDVFFEHYQNLIHIAKAKGIQVIITTVPYYFYKETSGHRKFAQVISDMNEGIKLLAIKNKVTCIDLYKSFEKTESYFIDEAHLSHEGMIVASELISASIKSLVTNRDGGLGKK